MKINEHIERALTIPGWMLRSELTWLFNVSRFMGTILEVGSWMGRSTYILCSSCKGTVFAVDHFRGSSEHQELIKAGIDPYVGFKGNMDKFENLVTIRADSRRAAEILCIPGKFDMVFLDGAHEYDEFMGDLAVWAARARVILCGHDGNYESIKRALSETFPGRHPRRVPETTLWYFPQVEGEDALFA